MTMASMRRPLAWLSLLTACASAPAARVSEGRPDPVELIALDQDVPADLTLVRIETRYLARPPSPRCPLGRPFEVDLLFRRGPDGAEQSVRASVECAWRTAGALKFAPLRVHVTSTGSLAIEAGVWDSRRATPALDRHVGAAADAERTVAAQSGGKLVSRVDPEIPADLRKSSVPHRYLLDVCIRQDGGVGRVRLSGPLHHPVVDARVLDAVRRWKYEPYEIRGVAVPRCAPVVLAL